MINPSLPLGTNKTLFPSVKSKKKKKKPKLPRGPEFLSSVLINSNAFGTGRGPKTRDPLLPIT